MHFPITSKVTLRDRFAAAYYAFCMSYRPDVERAMNMFNQMHEEETRQIEELALKRNAAIEQLQPYDIAIVDSIHGGTENWRELFDTAMLAVEQLSITDQITIIKYMFAGNRYIVSTLKFRQWMTVNAEELLNSIPE